MKLGKMLRRNSIKHKLKLGNAGPDASSEPKADNKKDSSDDVQDVDFEEVK